MSGGMHTIDQRAWSWTALVPGGLRIASASLPPAAVQPLGPRLDRNGKLWLGWEAERRDVPALGRYQAAVFVRPRGISSAWLREQGFPLVRSFAIVPRIGDARWFIPLSSRHSALRAWELYAPLRAVARLQKGMISLLTRGGLLPYAADTVIVAQRDHSELDTALMQALNQEQLHIAIATGTPGPRRRLTMQIAAPDGAVLAYAKYADRESTVAVVEREAQFLERVERLRLSAIRTPRQLHHGALAGGYLMVCTPLARARRTMGSALGKPHLDALAELANQHGAASAADLVNRLQQRIGALQSQIDQTWYTRLRGALSLATDVGALPSVMAHGDFAPWNVCIEPHSRLLAMYDWERGTAEQLPLWDAFHFQTMVDILVRRRSPAAILASVPAATWHLPPAQALRLSAAQVNALYIAYLVGICVEWFEDRAQGDEMSDDNDQRVRGQMLDMIRREV